MTVIVAAAEGIELSRSSMATALSRCVPGGGLVQTKVYGVSVSAASLRSPW